jgi:serine/threonine-protein kinase
VLSDLIVGDKYRLRRELGQGAMGAVWSASSVDREVAIKFLLPSLEGSDAAAARFVAEAKAAARVKHRYVVDVFDFGITEGGFYYMVQELLEGVALADSLYADPAWSLTDLLHFTAQCLSGLEAVHECGIIHRDLKPENIFVIRDAEGTRPKLLDFGISKVAESNLRHSLPARPGLRPGRPRALTVVGTTLGTPAYMSHEALCNAATLNGRADLYSLGVVMYEWLTGRVPFGETSNPTELYRRIHERSAPSLKALRPDLDLDLCEIVDRALDPEPALRFASASEMRAEILRVLPAQPLAYSTVQSPPRVEPASMPGPRVPLWAVDTSRADSEDDDRLSIPGLSRARTRGWAIGALAVASVVLVALVSWTSTDASPMRARPAVPQETAAKTDMMVLPSDVEPAADVPAGAAVPGDGLGLEPGAASLALGTEPPEATAAQRPTTAAPSPEEIQPRVGAAPPSEVSAPASVLRSRADEPPASVLRSRADEPRASTAVAPAPDVAEPRAAAPAPGIAAARSAASPAPLPLERVVHRVNAAASRSAVPTAGAAPRAPHHDDKVVRTLDF